MASAELGIRKFDERQRGLGDRATRQATRPLVGARAGLGGRNREVGAVPAGGALGKDEADDEIPGWRLSLGQRAGKEEVAFRASGGGEWSTGAD
jgi:hypothetical protein